MPCARKVDFANRLDGLVKDFHKSLADDFALALGVGDAREAAEKELFGAHGFHAHFEVVLEEPFDFGALVFAEKSVVDEHASEPVAERLVYERRRHRRVDPPLSPRITFLSPTFSRMSAIARST